MRQLIIPILTVIAVFTALAVSYPGFAEPEKHCTCTDNDGKFYTEVISGRVSGKNSGANDDGSNPVYYLYVDEDEKFTVTVPVNKDMFEKTPIGSTIAFKDRYFIKIKK